MPVLASQVVVTDLAAPMLAEPVSQQSVTMTQITSTLVRLLQWAWHPSHTPASQSALYPLLTDDMFPPDLLHELVSLLAPDPGHGGIPRGVQPAGAALPAGGCQHQPEPVSSLLLSLS